MQLSVRPQRVAAAQAQQGRRIFVAPIWSSGAVRHAPLAASTGASVAAHLPLVELAPPAGARRCGIVCHGTPGLMNLPLDRDLDEPLSGFDSIRKALDELAAGKFVVVLDDEDRENEGDLIIAADKVTTEAVHYMVEHTSGVICISMEGRDLDRLRLPLMLSSAENEEAMYTAFTVTVDLKGGITTGISASDRAKTIRHLANPAAQPSEFRRPGHIFPLRYRPGGVLVRPGHTEAGVDLARLAGCYPAGVLCEIVDRRDGSMARTPELLKYARREGLACITIADLVRYRLRHERLVVRTATARLHSPAYGPLTVHTYRCALDDSEHLAVVLGQQPAPQQQPVEAHEGCVPQGSSEASHHGSSGGPAEGHQQRPQRDAAVPVLVHREAHVQDLMLNTVGSLTAGTPESQPPVEALPVGMHAALAAMAQQGSGVLVYMRPRLEGRPGLAAQLRQLAGDAAPAPPQPQRGSDGMDIRVYGLAVQVLRDLGVHRVAALSHDPAQAAALASCGLHVQPYTARAAASGQQQQLQHQQGNAAAAAATPMAQHTVLDGSSSNGFRHSLASAGRH